MQAPPHGSARRRRSCGACLSLLLLPPLMTACQQPPPDTRPIRLTPLLFEEQRTRDMPPLNVALDQSWEVHGPGAVHPGPEGLVFQSEGAASSLGLEFVVDTARYNALRIRMRASAGGRCGFSWSSDLDPLSPIDGMNPTVVYPIFSDGGLHNYTLRLDARGLDAWSGHVSRILFMPTDQAATVEIHRMEFLYLPREQPRRITLGDVTLEAAFGTQPPWQFRVPPNAFFETHVGMLDRAWGLHLRATAGFQAALRDERGGEHVLFDTQLSPGVVERHREWVPLRADLSAFAGQEVTLFLNVYELNVPFGDYAFWGNPIVLSRAPEPEAIPVILISCDTLRAGHLSCYGHANKTSPVLDFWAANEAVLFENAISQGTNTLHSHMSMFTGLYPKNHRVTDLVNLADEIPTLPEMLRGQGYLTAGFTGHLWWLLPSRGFDRGLDYYDVPRSGFRHLYEIADRMHPWLDEHRHPRLFLFFHNYDIHAKADASRYRYPYDPGDPEYLIFSQMVKPADPFAEAFAAGIGSDRLLEKHNKGELLFSDAEHAFLRGLYDDCIRMVDDGIGRLFEQLERNGLYDNALIIVTSDHGEELNERGHYGHPGVYDELCHVPLIIKFPKNEFAGWRFSPQVEQIDIFETIRDVVGAPARYKSDGQSLRRVLRGELPPRPEAHVQRHEQHALRTLDWKLHWNRHWSRENWLLFHLAEDPGETQNLFHEHPPVLEPMRQTLRQFFRKDSDGWHLRIQACNAPWEGEVLLACDDRILACGRVNEDGFEKAVPVRKDNTVHLVITAEEWPHVVVRTGTAAPRLHVSLRAEAPFMVQAGGELTGMQTEFRALLDPAAANFAPPPDEDPPVEPIVYLWFESPETEQGGAAQPSPETEETLRALGYLN